MDLKTFNEYVSDRIVDDLMAVAKKIKHIGDYGSLYWNAKQQKVHWTMADGDEPYPTDEYPTTSSKDIKEMFGKISGVKSVQIGDEWSPQDEGWERIRYK